MRINSSTVHFAWDNRLPPVAEVGDGDRVELELLDASGGQLTPASGSSALLDIDFARVNPVTGPLLVRGAEPGDAVAVSILGLDVDAWGWAGLIPHFGLLADDFPDPVLVTAATAGDRVRLDFGVTLAARPMIGTMGVALPEPGSHPLLPPSRYGGNMDIRHLGAGATVLFPVGVSGALLSMGDAHATMGDGEVCGTGVETSARATVEVRLIKSRSPSFPVLETTSAPHREGPTLVTTGIGPELLVAARDAVRSMVEEICRRTGLAPEHAYVLTSLAGDLVISEIVDLPNFVVSLHLSTSLLG